MKSKTLKGLLALGLILGLSQTQKAWANNPDNMTISLTIAVNIDVAIDTTTTRWRDENAAADIPLVASSLDLGTLALGNTVYMLQPATVTVTTDFSGTELELQVVDTNLGGWTFDNDGLAAQDSLQVYALFGPTGTSDSPTIANYDDCTAPCGIGDDTGDQIFTTARRYGLDGTDDGTNNSVFQKSAYASASENFSSGSTSRHMFIRLDTPPSTTSAGAKDFRVVVNGVAQN